MVKHCSIVILILCLGITLAGCPKKTVMKEEPSSKKAEQLAIEREKKAKLEAERKEKEARETARIREEEARKAAAAKEFEKSLVAKKTPGIEGTVYESQLLKDIYFDYDKYEVRPGDTEVLKANAALLIKHPTMKVQIEGHCDERGTGEYNMALGQRRANSTRKYLISLGFPESRVSTISYGEEKPFDSGHSEDAWSKNRRAHFVILSK